MKINLLLLYIFLLLIFSNTLFSQNINGLVIPQESLEERIFQMEELKVKWKKNALDECSYICNVTTSNTGEVKTISLEELIIEFDLPDDFTGDPSEFGIELTDETGLKTFIEGELIEDIIPQDPRIQGFKIKKLKIRVKVSLKKIPDIGIVAKKLVFQPVAKFGTDVWKGFVREVITPIEKNLGKITASLPYKVTFNGLTEFKFEIKIDIQIGSLLKVKAVGYVVGGASGVTFGGAVTSLTIANFPVPQEYLPKYEKSMTWLEVAASVWCAFPANALSPPCVKFYSNQVYVDAFKAATGPKPKEALLRQYVIKPFIKDLNNLVTYGTEQILTFPPPEVVTKIASNEIAGALKLYGEIKNKDGFLLVKKGFVYATSPEPSLYDGIELVAGILSSDPIKGSTTIQPDQSFGEYTVNLKNPQVPGTYYYRAYAIDGVDTIYGTNQTFTVAGVTSVPGAPTAVVATAGNASASVAFVAPTNNGGSALTGYTVTSSPGGITATGATSPINVTGLTNDTAYTFTVVATNAVGNSLASSASSAVTPLALNTVPDPPTAVVATAGNASASVAFVAPTNNGGSAITGYTVTSSPGGITATGATSPINVTGLTNTTAYTFTVVATNAVGNSLASSASSAVTPSFTCGTYTITDVDGNTYNTVSIGTQCWTKENLRVTKYNDGTSIPLDNSGGTAGNGSGQTWGSRTIGVRTIYEHSQSNLTTYGYLYNWYAAKGIATTGSTSYKNLCPSGWHVPSDGEWTALTTFLGGEFIAGGKMKSTGTTLWSSPNTGTNVSGFTGLPGGYRKIDGRFDGIRFNAFVWSATEDGDNNAWGRLLEYFTNQLIRGNVNYDGKSVGASVRCLRD